MGEFPKHSRSNISGMVLVIYTTTKFGLLEHTVNSNRCFQMFQTMDGGAHAVTHNFQKFVVGQTACSCRVPLTINLIVLTGNVEEKEQKWRSRNFNFRIRADPLPPLQS